MCWVDDEGSVSVQKLEKLDTSTFSCKCKDNVTGLATLDNDKVIISNTENVQVWDTRSCSSVASLTLSDTKNKKKNFNCVAVNKTGLVVAGTEQVKDESFLMFWDLRQSGRLQGGYWESHCDDITSVSFRYRSVIAFLKIDCKSESKL